MAANMGMAGNSHLLMQQQQNNNSNQRQLQHIVYTRLVQNTPAIQPGGWQAGVQINDRLGKTVNLISNIMLAMPQTEYVKAVNYCLDFEQKCFFQSPDKSTYDQTMASKTAEMARKRQAAVPGLQNQMSAEAAARQQQAQAQAQVQQQMLMTQNAAIQAQLAARGMGQPGQQGFQHLRGPMQASQIPQQPQQMGMGTPGLQPPQQNQPPFMMNMQQRPVGSLQDRLNSLPPQQRMSIVEAANKAFAGQTEEQRQNARNLVQTRFSPQQLDEFRAQNQDPLMLHYQNQALLRAMQRGNMTMMRQQQAMGANATPAQAAMLQQQQQQLHQQQQRQQQLQQQQKQQMAMNPAMMNNLGLQPGMPGGQLFGPNMETIINEQKAGLLAEQSGQMVVPASNGANRNSTPQPMGGVGPQNMPNGQPGPNQQPRPPQMGQPFNLSQVKMNQAAAQSAAQSKAQAAAQQMQGQPGGLGGPASTSQSPAMNTLTAPMSQPPVAMGGMGQVNGARFGQGNPAMGQGLDQRFNHQANTRPISMSGNVNINSLNQMLSAMPADKRPNVSAMPPDKLRELMASWEQQQRNAMANGLMPQQPGPGQPQMGQMGNQFGGNPQQASNSNMPPNMQQAMMQSEMVRRRVSAATAQALAANPQAQVMMDSMDVPPNVLNGLMQSGLPPDVKKWGQLKAWMQGNPLTPQLQQQLHGFQVQQFRALMERRQAAAAAGPNGAPGGGPQQQQQQQQQQATPGQHVQQNLPNLPPGFRFPPQAMHVTPAEIQSLRNDPRYAAQDDQTLYKFAVRIKQEQFVRRFQMERLRKQQQEVQQQQLGVGNPPGASHLQQGGSAPQATATQPDMTNAAHAPASRQSGQKPATTNIEATTAGGQNNSNNNANKTAQNRPAPPNPSPATASKNLKRPIPDDVVEASNATNAANQQPNSQAAARPVGPQPTPEQMASWTPEQRQKWEQWQRRQQQDQEEMKRVSELFRTINSEELAANRDMKAVQMSAEERRDIETKLPKLVSDVYKFTRLLPKWYMITHDDHRTRLFFRMRARLMQQFGDEKQTQLKNAFSIRAQDASHFRTLLASMGQDLAANSVPRKPMPGNTANAGEATAPDTAAATNQSAAPASQQAPLNPANLEKHTQAMSKVHQRSNSKSGQAPAAPTTTQPPFQFGAQTSPTGQPTYFNKPAVTQETLNPPPPARKKAKTGHQQAASPAIPQSGPSPQIKAPSPEVKRQPQPEQPIAPSRPLFVCPKDQCDMHNTGFPTKEALDAHYHEEHVKPYEDPIKYTDEILTQVLGLDSQGNRVPKAGTGTTDISQPNAAAMKASGSRQGHTLGKLDPTSTPMSRTASMGRQSSAQGLKAGTPGNGKSIQIKGEGTPKPSTKHEPEHAQQATVEDAWANSTLDPAVLMATFAPLQPLANGHLSNFSPHRSRTPNDTPESSKDSGVSEPNSDISERAQLDIDMRWAPLDLDANTDLLVGMDAFSMGADDGMLGDGGSDFPMLWDELDSEFSKLDHTKAFELDTSLYDMHCS